MKDIEIIVEKVSKRRTRLKIVVNNSIHVDKKVKDYTAGVKYAQDYIPRLIAPVIYGEI